MHERQLGVLRLKVPHRKPGAPQLCGARQGRSAEAVSAPAGRVHSCSRRDSSRCYWFEQVAKQDTIPHMQASSAIVEVR